MIDEQSFINNLKIYDNSGLEFDSLDNMNAVISGAFMPLRKRGINDNEFTLINIGAFEVVNNDTVLALFNDIPPGPKEMERHRTYLEIGRYSQAIIPIIIIETNEGVFTILQKRNPINYNFEESTEILRDYVAKSEVENYYKDNFADLIEKSKDVNILPCGYFWENTGVIGVQTYVSMMHLNLKESNLKVAEIEKIINSKKLQSPQNIIGKRTLFLEKISVLKEYYANQFSLSNESQKTKYLNDLFSATALMCINHYL